MKVILGEELELKRQKQQLKWTQQFLTLEQNRLGHVEFLSAWSRHAKLQSEFHSFKYRKPRALDAVTADIELVGTVRVVAGFNGIPKAAASEAMSTGTCMLTHISSSVYTSHHVTLYILV